MDSCHIAMMVRLGLSSSYLSYLQQILTRTAFDTATNLESNIMIDTNNTLFSSKLEDKRGEI